MDLCHEIGLAYLLCGNVTLSSIRSIEHPDLANVDIVTNLDFTASDGRNIRIALDYLAPALIRPHHTIGLEQEIEYEIAHAKSPMSLRMSVLPRIWDKSETRCFWFLSWISWRFPKNEKPQILMPHAWTE